MPSKKDAIIRFFAPAPEGAAPPRGFSEKESAVLDTLNKKVAAAESLDRLLGFVFDSTRDIYPCDRLALAFVEENGRRVVAHTARAAYEPLVLGVGYFEDLRGSSLEKIIATGQLRIISDLEAYYDEHPNSASTRLLLDEGVRSSLTCPLSVDGRNAGLFFRSSREPDSYGEREVRLHQAVAERLGQAVEKAYRIGELTAANDAYTEMLGFVAHELKSPIAAIIMQADMLGQGGFGAMNPKQAELVGSITGKGKHLLDLVRDYLDLARIEGSGLKIKARKIGLGALMKAAEISAGTLIEARGMSLDRDLPREADKVECDVELLAVVVSNLLGNAAKYGTEGGRIKLKAGLGGGRLTVSVWNEGPGFSAEEKKSLFRKFSRLESPELRKQKGTGLGLYNCWRIIHLHGGRIWAESEKGRWAEFAFEIPQPGGPS
ncbi:MAG: GAF domain-containing sensor histidine kinase [Elusimicrobiota bacterium]